MAGDDVWSLITKELYPSDENGNGGTRTEALATEGKEGSPGGESVDEAIEGERSIPATCTFNSYALCVGMPGSGKSSLLNTYLNPNNDAIPKPTVALEYMFARRARAANAPKDVAHIWELGGGSHVSELVRVPITPDRFQSALYVIVLDLSKPGNVISHLLYWTDQIKACVKACVRELSKRDPTFADMLKKKTFSKFGPDHPDLRAVKPCPVPLVIVGNKYDVFKDQESARKRTLGQALRFIAHVNGASLLFCSSREKNLKDVLRLTLNMYLFRSSGRHKGSETNPERPLHVTAGTDTMDAILNHTPPGTRREDFLHGKTVADGAMDAWKRAVRDVFGEADPNDELPAKPGDDDYSGGRGTEGNKNPFPESTVDEHRAQRDEILLRYRKDAERREKLALKSANPPNKTGHYLAGASASSSAPAASARRHSKSSVEDKGYSARK